MAGTGDPDKGAVGEGHAHSLALAAVDALGSKDAADDTARGPARAAVHACAVAVVERSDDEVAPGDAVHLCPDLLHHADKLVADGCAWRVRGLAAVVPQVGAAHARQHSPGGA